MIDGDKGCWVFSSEGIVFKTEELMENRHIAWNGKANPSVKSKK